MSPYIKIHGRYSYESLKDIFNETDVLVVPSIWYETFGFTVLEALSCGVPVIISGTVGAKDVLVDGVGIVIEDIDAKKLCTMLGRVTRKKLEKMNKAIIEKQTILQINEMSEQIERDCYSWKC